MRIPQKSFSVNKIGLVNGKWKCPGFDGLETPSFKKIRDDGSNLTKMETPDPSDKHDPPGSCLSERIFQKTEKAAAV